MDARKLRDEERRECLRRIQRYFRDERGEDLGELAQTLIYLCLMMNTRSKMS